MTDALTRAGELAAAEIERIWKLDIIDPKRGSKDPRAKASLAEINRIIVRSGWGKPGEYKHNGKPQWCGMAAGDAWTTAGLDPAWLRVFWASTDRLVAWGGYKPFNGHANAKMPAVPGDRRVLVKVFPGRPLTIVPRVGDVAIVGDGDRVTGDHVTVSMGYDPARRVFDTISGNGGGVGPDGRSREGVSRKDYSIDTGDRRVMWIVRPAFGDLLAEKP